MLEMDAEERQSSRNRLILSLEKTSRSEHPGLDRSEFGHSATFRRSSIRDGKIRFEGRCPPDGDMTLRTCSGRFCHATSNEFQELKNRIDKVLETQ